MDLLDESLKILAINSVSQTGNGEIVAYLNSLLTKLGLPSKIHRTIYRSIEQQNLICRIEGTTSEEVIFNTHLDTVNPGDPNKWKSTQYNPFNPKIVGDHIYGLGSADTKLDYLCKLKALLKYKNENFINPLTFVGTFGEEMGLIGCNHFLTSGFVKPKIAFVGEPTSLNVVYAHKGMIVIRVELPLERRQDVVILRRTGRSRAGNRMENLHSETLEFNGESAHGSTPHLGKNAITMAVSKLTKSKKKELIKIEGGTAVNMVPIFAKMTTSPSDSGQNKTNLIKFFNSLDEIEKNLHEDKDPLYDPAHSVLNVGTICTDTTKIVIRIAFRMLPNRDFQPILNKLENDLASIEGLVFLERDQPAMYTDKDGFLVKTSLKILNELGIQSKAETKPASTEAALYQKWGAQAIIFGPGIAFNNIHKPNEYNLISHLHKAVSFYEKVIELFCLKKIRMK